MENGHVKETLDKDYDDSNSMRSLDLEEAKAMLQDELDRPSFRPTKKQSINTCVQICSISVNIFFFLFLLAILHNPCQFSSKSCTYTGSDELILMAEEHGYVPQCKHYAYQAKKLLTASSWPRKSYIHERLKLCE
jgi:hypothetical protein